MEQRLPVSGPLARWPRSQLRWHSATDASRSAALLVGRVQPGILPPRVLLSGASAPSVRTAVAKGATNWRTGLDLGAAREKVRVAGALADLPLVSAAMQRGQLSYSKVRALTRVATPENERSLLDFAGCGTASHVERLVRAWRRVDRVAEARDEQRRHETRELRTWVDDDGMVVVRGRLSPEVGAVVMRALDAGSERLRQEATATDLDRGSSGDRFQVVVHVDESVLEHDDAPGQSALEDGPYVSAETSRRVACDAGTVTMRHRPDGQVLNVGRKTRTVPPALRRALTARDRRCRFLGCSAKHCDAHHVRHWAQGGATRLDNLLLLCRRHHRAVHEGRFTVTVGDDGEARFSWPDGRPLGAALGWLAARTNLVAVSGPRNHDRTDARQHRIGTASVSISRMRSTYSGGRHRRPRERAPETPLSGVCRTALRADGRRGSSRPR